VNRHINQYSIVALKSKDKYKRYTSDNCLSIELITIHILPSSMSDKSQYYARISLSVKKD